MELHVSGMITLKMPIIVVSTDAPNLLLSSIPKDIDVLFEAQDATELSDKILDGSVAKRYTVDALNTNSDAIRFQAVVNVIRQMSVYSAVIVCHSSVSGLALDEWEIIEM